jgi:2-C-methyl-D-erythritol 4-phosphate cytidylyltransferase
MNYAVVLAGGKGQRFGNKKISKQFVELTGVPMIVYSLRTADKKKILKYVFSSRKRRKNVKHG